jgi:taurine dioxygenase
MRRRLAIRDAWHEHIVLLFRDQDLSEDDQVTFAEKFGTVGTRSRPASRRPEGADYNASIMLVSNIKKDGEYIGSLPDGEMWFHHDMCYDPAPHKGTFLYAMELPSSGGNTLFANMYAAYDRLSDETKARLKGLARHYRSMISRRARLSIFRAISPSTSTALSR